MPQFDPKTAKLYEPKKFDPSTATMFKEEEALTPQEQGISTLLDVKDNLASDDPTKVAQTVDAYTNYVRQTPTNPIKEIEAITAKQSSTAVDIGKLQPEKKPQVYKRPETTIGEGTTKLTGEISPEESAQAFNILNRMESEGLTATQAEKSFRNPAQELGGSFAQGLVGVVGGVARLPESVGVDALKPIADDLQKLGQHLTPNEMEYIHKIFSGMGSMTAMVGPGLLAGGLLKTMANPKVAAWIASGVSGTLESMAEAGNVFQEVVDETGDRDLAKDATYKTFLANMILVPLTNKFGIFGDQVEGFKKALLSAPIEALQEGMQNVISTLAQNKDINMDEVIEDAGLGAILGGGVGFVIPSTTAAKTKPKPEEIKTQQVGDIIKLPPDTKKTEEILSEEPRQQPSKEKEVAVKEVVQKIEETKPKIDERVGKIEKTDLHADFDKDGYEVSKRNDGNYDVIGGEHGNYHGVLAEDVNRKLKNIKRSINKSRGSLERGEVQFARYKKTGSYYGEYAGEEIRISDHGDKFDNAEKDYEFSVINSVGFYHKDNYRDIVFEDKYALRKFRVIEQEIKKRISQPQPEQKKAKVDGDTLGGEPTTSPGVEKDNTKKKTELIDQYFETKDFRKTKGNKSRQTHKQLRDTARELQKIGVNAKVDVNDNLLIDGKTFRKPEDVEIENKEAEIPFKDLPQNEVDVQQNLAGHIDAEMLPKGIGEKKADKGIKDIRENDGKEQTTEAKIVRDAIKGIQEEGFIPKHTGKKLVTPEEVAGLGKQKEETPSELKVAEQELRELEDDIFVEDEELELAREKVEGLKKPTQPSKTVVKTKAGDQPFLSSEMAKPKALEPKKVDKDVGEAGSPLFEQKEEDKGQVEAFEEEKTITDPARVQEIENSIEEGELILKTGKLHGRKFSKEELEGVKLQVARDKAKIGKEPKTNYKDYFKLSQKLDNFLAKYVQEKDLVDDSYYIAKKAIAEIDKKSYKDEDLRDSFAKWMRGETSTTELRGIMKRANLDYWGNLKHGAAIDLLDTIQPEKKAGKGKLFQKAPNLLSTLSKQELAKELELVNKLLPHGFTVEVNDKLVDENNNPARGQFLPKQKKIIVNPNFADLTTIPHEILHGSLFIADPIGARILLKENGWDGKGDIADLSNESLREAHEALAEKFEQWYTDNKRFNSTYNRVFTKLKELIQKIADAYKGKLPSQELQYFKDLADGKLNGTYDTGFGEPAFVMQKLKDAFYSKVEQLVGQKSPGKNIRKEQLIPMLVKSGARKEELEWLDIDSFLEENPKATKQELLDYVKANNVKIEVVEKGKHGSEKLQEEWDILASKVNKSIRENGVDHKITENLRDQRDEKKDEIVKSTEDFESTKFSQWQLEGEKENYREILITMPSNKVKEKRFTDTTDALHFAKKVGGTVTSDFNTTPPETIITYGREKDFRSPHFAEPNILVHTRVNDRTIDGKKTLFIEEIQSDWHQAGRKKGYKSEQAKIEAKKKIVKLKKEFYELEDQRGYDARAIKSEIAILEEQSVGQIDKVPDAPFKKTWHELGLKHLLRKATEEGYSAIAWTTGEQQAERYDLSKQVNEIRVSPIDETKTGVFIMMADNSDVMIYVDRNGKIVEHADFQTNLDWVGKQLDEVIGKEIAEKILKSESRKLTLKDQDLKVGGEGMKGFYDKILPSYMNKYGKKWGARVGEGDFGVGVGEDRKTVHTFPITDKMKESVLQGQPLFQKEKTFQEEITDEYGAKENPVHKEDSKIGEWINKWLGKAIYADESLVEFGVRKFIDRNVRAKKLSEGVHDEIDFYAKMELYTQKAADQYEKILDYLTDKENGFLKRVNDAGFTVNQMGDYLWAKHAIERNEAILEKNGNENGSGRTDLEAEAVLKKYESTDIEKYAKEFRKEVLGKKLQVLKDAEVITEAEIEQFEQYRYYVPLKGTPKRTSRILGGKKFSVGGTGIMEAKGRTSIPENPFVQGILDLRDAIIRAEKNKVNQTFLDYIAENPNEEVYTVRGRKAIPSFDSKGEIRQITKEKLDENQIAVYKVIDGKRKQKVITIKDESLARSMANLGIRNNLMFMRSFNDYLRTVVTIANPEFIITNFERDLQSALINISGEKSSRLARKVLKDTRKAMATFYKGKKATGEWAKWLEEYKASGAKIGWMDNRSMDELSADFKKQIDNFNKKGHIRKVFDKTVKFVEDINMAVENGVRLATYVNMRKEGVSQQRAAQFAKDLTVNFERKGEWGEVINSGYLFWNAGMQGANKIFRVMKSGKARKIAGSLIFMSVLQNVINRAVDDDDYEKLSDYEKDNHWIFMLGNGKYLKIKLPYGWNVFNVFGNVVADIQNGSTDIEHGAGRLGNSFADAFNPFGAAGSWMQILSPTIIDPAIQIAENKNFFGSPIAKEQPAFQPNIPDSELYFKSVNPLLREMTTFLNKATGGSETRSGIVDMNPETIEHLAEFLGGGAGKFVSNAVKTTGSLIEGETPKLNKVPLLRKIIGEENEYYDLGIIYGLSKNIAREKFSDFERERFLISLKNALKTGKITRKQHKRFMSDYRKHQLNIGPSKKRKIR